MQLFNLQLTQSWTDVAIWETFLNQYEVRTLVELGTGNGAMTLFFAAQCYQRKIFFHTFDNQKWMDFDNGLAKLMNIESVFHFVDLFSEEGISHVKTILEKMPHPVAIFFDDGDKPREWELFAPLTSPGDFCIVHDWGEEFFEKDLLDVPVERILQKECDLRNPTDWKAMWFRRI